MSYNLIIAGTGFASSFFLKAALSKLPPTAKVLVLERGKKDAHRWQVQERRNSSIYEQDTFVSRKKRWRAITGFGGGSNGWYGCTPRFLPSDFEMQTRYGIARDWPVSYDDLDPFYTRAEAIMSISGQKKNPQFPREIPYPQPPHRLSDVDKLLQQAFPASFVPQSTARARVATDKRPACCATGFCDFCPVNAKFTIQNEMMGPYEDPRVTLALEAEVKEVLHSGDTATGVRYLQNGERKTANADTIMLGTNALFNPWILMQSGLDHPLLGKGIIEQIGRYVNLELDGIDNFNGSTVITGHGYMHYDGPHRAERAASIIETWNNPSLRMERGKWRQRLRLKFIYEDLPEERNHLKASDKNPALPELVYEGHSAYAQRSIDNLQDDLKPIVAALPVEEVREDRFEATEAHILGGTIMGNDPRDSIVDANLIHHRLRNLVVVSGGAFPTITPANPSLTISALALLAAEKYYG